MRQLKTSIFTANSQHRRTVFAVFLLLFFSIISTLSCPSVLNAAWEPILAPMKKVVPLGFKEGFMLEPNILLLLDTSGSMVFRTEDDDPTRGDGSRPAFHKGDNGHGIRHESTQWYFDGSYFGRDTNSDNNDPSNPNNYHSLLRYIDSTEESADLPQQVYSATQIVFDELSSTQKNNWFATDGGRYLFPNDSRMYKLKLVLWRILNDPSLVSNLRMGLATYYQDDGFARSDWYRFYPWGEWEYSYSGSYWYWDDWQDTYWTAGSSTNYALLREGFSSTNEQGHLNALKKWVDGAEYYDVPDYEDNLELRADGNTPLASSIYNTTNPSDCAYDYFEDNGVIKGWCQDNYLIVLTDGADTDPAFGDTDDPRHKTKPIERVQLLYDNSQNINVFYEQPNRPVKTLVIGFIDPESPTNADLKNTLNQMADVGWDGESDDIGPRGEDTEDQAFFANDVDALLTAFTEIFTLIQQKSGTAGAPLISPGSKTGEETGSVYVASFVPNPNDQWEGKFHKYTLETTGLS